MRWINVGEVLPSVNKGYEKSVIAWSHGFWKECLYSNEDGFYTYGENYKIIKLNEVTHWFSPIIPGSND